MASPYGPVSYSTNHRLVCPSSDRWLIHNIDAKWAIRP